MALDSSREHEADGHRGPVSSTGRAAAASRMESGWVRTVADLLHLSRVGRTVSRRQQATAFLFSAQVAKQVLS